MGRVFEESDCTLLTRAPVKSRHVLLPSQYELTFSSKTDPLSYYPTFYSTISLTLLISIFPSRMAQVYHDFRHSKDVIKELAREGAVTPPPNDAPARHYIDMSLRILGRTHIITDGRIQREFLQQQSLIHSILEQKQQEADQHFLSTREQIQDLRLEVHERFEAVQTEMHERFKAVRKEMREGFETVHKKFDEKFKTLNERFDRLEGDIGQAIDASHNRLRVRGWDNINPVRMIGLDGKSAGVPDCFPNTVRKFWALKLPSRCEYLGHQAIYIRAR